MRIVIYATCQGRILVDYLQQQIPGSSAVSIHNYEYIAGDRLVTDDEHNRQILAAADVLIYQPLSSKYGKNSSDHILSAVSDQCIKISIPYLYNHSFWPLCVALQADLEDQPDRQLIFARQIKNREIIDSLFDRGISVDEVIEMFDRGMIDFQCQQRFQDCQDHLIRNESLCDVRVADFINEQYLDHKMFYYPSHPTAVLMQHMADSICDLLEVSPLPVDTNQVWFPGVASPYWSGTVKSLCLRYEPDYQANEFYHKIICQLGEEKHE